jgi:ppGpp synthetase/RelA/SpoT-type nucleotidyltranferase
MATEHIQPMQKALDQMNVHHALSDITGLTGLRIVDSIVRGERDANKLAKLRDGRVKASEEEIAQALRGEYRSEHLFVLRQSLEAYRQCQK